MPFNNDFMAGKDKSNDEKTNDFGKGSNVPPPLEFVIIFFNQKKETFEEANSFYAFYHRNGWTTIEGNKVKSWKTKDNEWIWSKYHYKLLRRPDNKV